MKPYSIFTASDAKYGDFLIDHWYESLRETCDLAEIDVVVLDYGLSTAQRYYLADHGVILAQYPKNGHVAVIRFRDLADFLSTNTYRQVLLADGGDIIFQDDISHLFTEHSDTFRGVREDLKSGFTVFLTDEFFSREDKQRIRNSLYDAKMVNAGCILGPGEKMLQLGRTVDRMIISKTKFGPDQLVVNYVFNTEGFQPLDRKFNYVIATARANLEIRDNRFYADGELIPVVHNTGNFSFLRPVENFGFGADRNTLKTDLLKALQTLHTTSDTLYETRAELRKRVKSLREELNKGYQKSQRQLEESWDDFKNLFFGDTD